MYINISLKKADTGCYTISFYIKLISQMFLRVSYKAQHEISHFMHILIYTICDSIHRIYLNL